MARAVLAKQAANTAPKSEENMMLLAMLVPDGGQERSNGIQEANSQQNAERKKQKASGGDARYQDTASNSFIINAKAMLRRMLSG